MRDTSMHTLLKYSNVIIILLHSLTCRYQAVLDKGSCRTNSFSLKMKVEIKWKVSNWMLRSAYSGMGGTDNAEFLCSRAAANCLEATSPTCHWGSQYGPHNRGFEIVIFCPTRRQKSKNLMAKISGPTRNGMTSQRQLGEDKVKGGHNGKTSPCNDPTKCFLMVRLLREYTTQVYSRTYSKWRLELSLFLTWQVTGSCARFCHGQ